MIFLFIYLIVGLVGACWYIWQLGGVDRFYTQDLARMFVGWMLLWPVIGGFIGIWKGLEYLAKRFG
jgi:hypothetical protein